MSIKFLSNRWVAIFFAIVFIGPLTWIALDRTPPFILLSGVSIPAEIKRGSDYRIEWTIRNIPGKKCQGTAYRFLRDSSGRMWTFLPSPASFGLIDDNMSMSETHVSGYQRKMPSDVALGEAKFYFQVQFFCNITQYIWPLIVEYPSVDTKIID